MAMNLVDQINQHKYLYLDKLIELADHKPELWVSEARAKSNRETDNAVAYRPIVTDEFCKSYKIAIDNCVAYCVTSEHCTQVNEDEEYEGNLFRYYSKSRFLSFAKDSMSFEHVEEIVEKKVRHI